MFIFYKLSDKILKIFTNLNVYYTLNYSEFNINIKRHLIN